MNKTKILIVLIFSLISFNVFSLEQKPSISLYILGDNENNQSIKTSIQSILNQNGFLIKDGNNVLKDLNFKKTENLQYILENSSILSEINDAQIMITLRLNYKLIQKNSSSIFISSEIYNTKTKNYISSWSTPRKILNYPKECNQICKNLLLTEKIILLSDQLGNSIKRILEAKLKEVKSYNNISKIYNFKLYNFKETDIIYLTDIMTNEFPGFIKISNEQSFGKQNSWSYYSSTDMFKLKKWIVITLSDISLSIDKDYEILLSDNNFFIKKFPSFNPLGSKGNTQKFN
jgi:hypothetical protein